MYLTKEEKRKLDIKELADGIKTHKKSDSPKISVIVPVYKVDKYLTCCLDSIVNQTLEDIEIIIVDEGDEDRCREIIDFYERIDPRVIAPHKKNGGYGASCNLGFSLAKGEYLAVVESDDYIETAMFEDLYHYAKSLDADVVKTPYSEYFSDGRKYDCSFRHRLREGVPQNKCFSVKEFGLPLEIHAALWSGIYRTSYMKENKIKFIEAKGAAYVDVGFRIETLINTKKFAWLDKPYYNYRMDNDGSSTNNFNLSAMILRWREIHELLDDKEKSFITYYGKHLILDEYLNTVGWLWELDATTEEYESIAENMNYITEELINTAPSLNKKQKEDLLLFKKNKECFRNKTIKYRRDKKLYFGCNGFLEGVTSLDLLKWLFVGLLSSVVTNYSVKGSMYQNIISLTSEELLLNLSAIISLLFSLAIAGCYIGKIIRKILLIIQNSRK